MKLIVWFSPDTGDKAQCLTRVEFISGDYGEEREEQVLKVFSRKVTVIQAVEFMLGKKKINRE